MLGIEGKSMLVTGAASGMGRATALLLAEEGALVTAVDVDAEGLQETVSLGASFPGALQSAVASVTDEDEVNGAVASAVESYGRLDGACNAAGVPQSMSSLHEVSAAALRRVIDINLVGVCFCMKYEILEMLKVGGGAIVNVSSTAALKGYSQASEYSAAKAGLIGLARAAVQDYAAQGIRINTIFPGPVDTKMMRFSMDSTPGLEELMLKETFLGRLGQPLELARPIRWLLSDEASFVVGANITVDGGQST